MWAVSASAVWSAARCMTARMSCFASRDGTTKNVRVVKLYQFEGLKRVEVESAKLGDIVAVSGITDLNIGETVCVPDCVEPLPFVKIDEPTVSMIFMVNNSPFAGPRRQVRHLPQPAGPPVQRGGDQRVPCGWRRLTPPTRSR